EGVIEGDIGVPAHAWDHESLPVALRSRWFGRGHRHGRCSLPGLEVVPYIWQVGMRIGSEVAQADKRLAAGVLGGDALAGPLGGEEDLVLGDLAIPDEVGAVDGQLADRAAALDDDQAIGAGILEGRRAAGLDGQLARAEELLAVDAAVDDPLVDV